MLHAHAHRVIRLALHYGRVGSSRCEWSYRQQQQQISPYFDPTYHTLARAGLANRLLDRHEVVTIDGDVDTLRQATP